jgi:hypothetical protein
MGREKDLRYWDWVVMACQALNAELELSFICKAFRKD